MDVRIGKTYLDVPNGKGKLSFQYPPFKGCFCNVASEIDKEGLKRPTSPETVSLVYDAFKNLKGKYESEIKGILRGNWLWEFTGNFYLPKSNEEINNGVILESNPQISRVLVMDEQSLIKRLKANDPLVKFVPFGFKIGEQTPLDLSKNPYIIARYGEEGADKIEKIASMYRENPKLNSFNSVNKKMLGISALGGGDFDWSGLSVIDNYWGDDFFYGHAFGVLV